MPLLPTPPPDDPVPTAARWLEEAEALGRRNANAIALASADRTGHLPGRRVHEPDELGRRRVDQGQELRPELVLSGKRCQLLDPVGAVDRRGVDDARDETELRVILGELGDHLGERHRIGGMRGEAAGPFEFIRDHADGGSPAVRAAGDREISGAESG